MTRVLLIDDDTELCQMLAEYLVLEGFEVEKAHDGESGVIQALSGRFDIIVLDIMLPKRSGLDALRDIRQQSFVPVVMLTAKGDDTNRIVGLELGADDYVPKPFNPRELIARLRAILRRAYPQYSKNAESVPRSGGTLKVGEILLRPGERLAQWQGTPLALTSTEYSLLEILVRNAGKTVSKADLSEQALGRPQARFDRTIDVHISNLRQKLGSLPEGRSMIQTVRNIGYQFIVM